MRSLYVPIDEDTFLSLGRIARAEGRQPREIAARLVADGLERRSRSSDPFLDALVDAYHAAKRAEVSRETTPGR